MFMHIQSYISFFHFRFFLQTFLFFENAFQCPWIHRNDKVKVYEFYIFLKKKSCNSFTFTGYNCAVYGKKRHGNLFFSKNNIIMNSWWGKETEIFVHKKWWGTPLEKIGFIEKWEERKLWFNSYVIEASQPRPNICDSW